MEGSSSHSTLSHSTSPLSLNETETEESDGYIQMMLERETVLFKTQSSNIAIDEQIQCARLEAIKWVLHIRSSFGFRHQTAYLAIDYFDRVLSKRMIDVRERDWAISLLTVACLTLAAKMVESLIPALPEFQIDPYNFDGKVIQRMELLVLNTLGWNMNSITPFAYINFFAKWFSDESMKKTLILSKITEIILSSLRDGSVMGYRPSVIAGAATLVAADQKLTRREIESKIKIEHLSSSGFLDIEDVFCCYGKMVELPKCLKSPNQLSVASTVGKKRKRLAFTGTHQNSDKI